jgi:hypothetical protein
MSKKSKKKNRKHIKPESGSIPSLPDRRAMEKTLADIVDEVHYSDRKLS